MYHLCMYNLHFNGMLGHCIFFSPLTAIWILIVPFPSQISTAITSKPSLWQSALLFLSNPSQVLSCKGCYNNTCNLNTCYKNLNLSLVYDWCVSICPVMDWQCTPPHLMPCAAWDRLQTTPHPQLPNRDQDNRLEDRWKNNLYIH